MEVTANLQAEATTGAVGPPFGRGRPENGAAGTFMAELFERHSKMVLGLCRLLLRDRVEAEDAMQQTFLSAYRSILGGSVPREPAAWLATIARNESLSRIRGRMREPLADPDHALAGTAPDALAAAIANADLRALARGIKALPRRQREALLLREFSGLSYGELAVALGVSEPAVESLLFRARRGLKTAMANGYAALPLPVALREVLARSLAGGSSAAGPIAKLAALPVVVKVATGAVAVGIVTAGAVTADRGLSIRHSRPRAHPRISARLSHGPVPAPHVQAVTSVSRPAHGSPGSPLTAAASSPSPAHKVQDPSAGGDAQTQAPPSSSRAEHRAGGNGDGQAAGKAGSDASGNAGRSPKSKGNGQSQALRGEVKHSSPAPASQAPKGPEAANGSGPSGLNDPTQGGSGDGGKGHSGSGDGHSGKGG
jgi:RNA polymerase sigma-70 factor (ECF subfamily)